MKKLLSKDEQRAYLHSKIGEPVNFKYPEPPYLLEGELSDRFVFEDGEDDRVLYWFVIDLIKFKGEDENWLRMTYYRYKKKEKRWVFAGQTSLSGPNSEFENLFAEAIKEKKWVK